MNPDDVKNYYDTRLESCSYEEKRWFNDPLREAGYFMMQNFLEHFVRHVKHMSPKTYLELGPGPGTWTSHFVKNWPRATFQLVEISEEMTKALTKRFAGRPGVTITNTNFLEYTPGKTVDFFFASRALEYLPDKAKAVQHIALMLGWGGEGLVITKTPKYSLDRLLRRSVPAIHQGQVGPHELRSLLEKSGLEVIGSYPVTFTFPFLGSPNLNLFLARLLHRIPLTLLLTPFTESYALYFKKV